MAASCIAVSSDTASADRPNTLVSSHAAAAAAAAGTGVSASDD